MGKIIGGMVKIILGTIALIPFIGRPTVNVIIFVLDNLFALIKKLPYIIGFAVVGVIAASYLGVL